MSGSQIRVHIGGRLRPRIQAVGVTNPVGAVDIDPAPLMSPLVFVDVLIGDTEDIQAQSCGSGTSGAGGHAQDKIAIGVIIVRYIGGVGHAAVEHPAQFLHDASELKIVASPGELAQEKDAGSGFNGFLELPVVKPDVEMPVVELYLKD